MLLFRQPLISRLSLSDRDLQSFFIARFAAVRQSSGDLLDQPDYRQ